jgi:hypothetical protein
MADSQTGDPDADAVLSMSAPAAPVASATGDPDADAVLNASTSDATPKPVENTWWNAVKGVGESALAMGTGTLKAVTSAVNDILPGEEGRKQLAQEIEKDPILNYTPGPEAAPITEALNTVGKPIGQALHFAHDTIANLTSPRTADVVGDLATIGASYGALGGKEPIPETPQSKALEEAQKLGYVVPPSTTNPTLLNKAVEGFAGKLSTAQEASVRNQEITNGLVRKEFGLPADAALSPETMDTIRATQGKAYQAVSQVPDIKFGADYNKALDSLAVTSKKITDALPSYRSTGAQQVQELIDSLKPTNGVMDGETAVELSKSLRSEASSYQAAADRMGDPQARLLARTYRGAAEAVENAVENHLIATHQGQLADAWDNARRTIAKTYSVENAMDGAGNVDALKLGKQLLKGKPLSDNLEAAANFANAFPKAARNLKESFPGISPLDYYAGAALEGVTHNPAALAAGPLRMGVRSTLLGPVGQYMAKPGNATLLGTGTRLAIRGTPTLQELMQQVPAIEQEKQQ